jgi:hypothetical protein
MEKVIQNNVLHLEEMSTAIQKLTELLTGRVFDFSYILSEDIAPSIPSLNQRLSLESINPIHLEKRGQKDHKREFLVFVVDGEDDLLVSVSNWIGILDITIKDNRKIIIKNHEGDVYKINIHSGEK